MTRETEHDGSSLAPDDAFAVVANETRMAILRTVGDADGQLSFSDLRDRVGVRDSGQFNYHLDQLTGHFIRKSDDGYEIRQAGRRVIEAVLSGAITESPVLEPTQVDDPCPICGAQTLVAYHEERMQAFCTECEGWYGRATNGEFDAGADYGVLRSARLPPAGVQGRSAEAVAQAAGTWGLLEYISMASGLCPSCSARLEKSVRVCESHDAADGICPACTNRHGIRLHVRCPNCFREQSGAFFFGLLDNVDLQAFLIAHGINPVSPGSAGAYDAIVADYDEEVLSGDPFSARFTFTAGDDSLMLTVDDELSVVDVTKQPSPDSDRNERQSEGV